VDRTPGAGQVAQTQEDREHWVAELRDNSAPNIVAFSLLHLADGEVWDHVNYDVNMILMYTGASLSEAMDGR
jgi:hypothetical protein